MKKTRGITLIALIVTIIVLLILAGVTIRLTLGEKGIFKLAELARKNYTNAALYEANELDKFLDKTEHIPTIEEENFITLYSGKANETTSIYDLADTIDNYDYLIIYCDNSTAGGMVSMMIETSVIMENDLDQFFMTNSGNVSATLRYIRFGFLDKNKFKLSNTTGNSYIKRIAGLKKGKIKKVELLTSVANEEKEYALSQSINNFDYVLVYADNEEIQGTSTSILGKEIAKTNGFLTINWDSNMTRAIRYHFANDKILKVIAISHQSKIIRIVGLQFNHAEKQILYSGTESENNKKYVLTDNIRNYDMIVTYADCQTPKGMASNILETKYIEEGKGKYMATLSPSNTIRIVRFIFEDLNSFTTYGIVGQAYIPRIEAIRFK